MQTVPILHCMLLNLQALEILLYTISIIFNGMFSSSILLNEASDKIQQILKNVPKIWYIPKTNTLFSLFVKSLYQPLLT